MPEENLPPKNLIPRAELDALKTRVALHIDTFCQELFPYGYLALRWLLGRTEALYRARYSVRHKHQDQLRAGKRKREEECPSGSRL